MRVRLLGTAAGGGFPQWNCNCANCRGVRQGIVSAHPRTQSCVAVSADGRRWFLVNVSPDIRVQFDSFPPLLPHGSPRRGTGVEGILLTNADLDHTLGLLVLREGARLTVHATAAVRQALTDGLSLSAVLERYCGVDWRVPPTKLLPLLDRECQPSGLSYAAFPVPGHPPRYWPDRLINSNGACVGYRLVDEAMGGRLIVMPDVAELSDTVMAELQDADALLLDGTFWSEDEMLTVGVGTVSASQMGHLPVGGPNGSLVRIAALPIPYKIYIHINNTNPMLINDSPEHSAVLAAGAEIGEDGVEFDL